MPSKHRTAFPFRKRRFLVHALHAEGDGPVTSTRTVSLVFAVVLAAISFVSCGFPSSNWVILATTTSFQDSGLLDAVVSAFERTRGERMKYVACGSGEALRMGERGDADIVIAHSPSREARFMAEGYGIERVTFMRSGFFVAGPRRDPAGVRRAHDAVEAFRMIARRGALFASRGDASGTDDLEKELWKEAGLRPFSCGWYIETGQGMAETLFIADQKRSYTLCDRATYLSMKNIQELQPLFFRDPRLFLPYSAILVRGHGGGVDDRRKERARKFLQFLVSRECKELIASYPQKDSPYFIPVDDEGSRTEGESTSGF